MVWIPDENYDDIHQISDSLGLISKSFGVASADIFSKVIHFWEEVVGDDIAKVSKPVALVNNALNVEVSDREVSMRLKWMGGQIADSLNKKLGGNEVEHLRFKVAK